MAEEAQERVGDLIDERYKLVQVMASGSMGAVYKAERVPVGKVVAVKFLHSSFAHDSEFQARFDRETRVMSKLAHPNCVGVIDFGVWKTEPYLVMDFVAGTTLRTREDEVGRLPVGQALAFARQIAAGLAHAHAQGIVHRDIKPANIMITDEIGSGERVRILDFGLARLRGNVGRDATQTNLVVGTPNYMAPEQTVPGGTIDARTDIYAVGVVLFEMIAGERPFSADDMMQLLGMHRAAPTPRLADRVPDDVDLPDGLQSIIDTAMAKSPKDRYQSAIELANALDAVAGVSVPAISIPTGGRARTTGAAQLVGVKQTSGSPAVGSRKKTMGGTIALEPTELEIESSGPTASSAEPKRPSKFWRYLVTATILLGGTAVMAGYMMKRGDASNGQPPRVVRGVTAKRAEPAHEGHEAVPPPTTNPTNPTNPTTTPAAVPADAMAANPTGSGSAVASATPNGVPSSDAGVVEPGSAAPAAVDAAVAHAPDTAGSATGSAGSDDEADPSKAEDPDPEAKTGSAEAATDEAADAPKTTAEVEKHAHPPQAAPQIATNLHDAVMLLKDGKRDLARASLVGLHAKIPKSAYIPFLLGNLYFDQRWWSVAMDYYAEAIKKNPEYRQNPTISRNVIRMLASPKTQGRASGFLRGTIGHPAAAYLRFAATHEPNPAVRKQAAYLARYIR